jgi:hypothetical protein
VVAPRAQLPKRGGRYLLASGYYAWDMPGGGFPLQPIQTELFAMGFPPVRPPSSDVSKVEALQNLWTDAGLDRVETRKIEVQRTFTDFDDFWTTAMLGSTIGPTVASMPPDDAELLKGECARVYPQMLQGALPTVHGQTRLRVAYQLKQPHCGGDEGAPCCC